MKIQFHERKRCECCGEQTGDGSVVFEFELNSYRTSAARWAGVYESLWKLDKNPVERVGDWRPLLSGAIQMLAMYPGDEENLFGDELRPLLTACRRYKNAVPKLV